MTDDTEGYGTMPGMDAVRALNDHYANGSKASNPKDAVGVRKARWFSYLPLRVLVGVGLAMLEGARKYGRHNYRVAGVRCSVYVDAAVCGHLGPFMEGEDIDPDSGLHHIDKAIASLMVLRDGILEGNWVDDRPPRGNFDWAGANAHAAALIDKYPDPKPAFTEAERDPFYDPRTGRRAGTITPIRLP